MSTDADGGFCSHCDQWVGWDDMQWNDGRCPHCNKPSSVNLISRRESRNLLARNLESLRQQRKALGEKRAS